MSQKNFLLTVAAALAAVACAFFIIARPQWLEKKLAGNPPAKNSEPVSAEAADGSAAAAAEDSAPETPSAEVSSGWQVYRHEGYGFEMQIPADWYHAKTNSGQSAEVDLLFRNADHDLAWYQTVEGEWYDLTVTFQTPDYFEHDGKGDAAAEFAADRAAVYEDLARRHVAEQPSSSVDAKKIFVGGRPAAMITYRGPSGEAEQAYLSTLYRNDSGPIEMSLHLAGENVDLNAQKILESLSFFQRDPYVSTCLGRFVSPLADDVLVRGDRHWLKWEIPVPDRYHLNIYLHREDGSLVGNAISWNWAKEADTETVWEVGEYYTPEPLETEVNGEVFRVDQLVEAGFVDPGVYRLRFEYDYTGEEENQPATGCRDKGSFESELFEIR